MTGNVAPYESEREASAAARAIIPPEPGWSILSQEQRDELLRRTLDGAGVKTNGFEDDQRWWLGNWSDHLAAVVARWVTAAHEAGKAARPEPAETEWGIRYPVGHPEERVRNFGSEDGEHMARLLLPDVLKASGDGTALVCRGIGPWTPAPKTPPGEPGEEGR
jgi:hypothetical protein